MGDSDITCILNQNIEKIPNLLDKLFYRLSHKVKKLDNFLNDLCVAEREDLEIPEDRECCENTMDRCIYNDSGELYFHFYCDDCGETQDMVGFWPWEGRAATALSIEKFAEKYNFRMI